ncbi:DNA repair ATPase [Streptomyces sp.]|uniref:DNA repair ATPase n=1 Tax=Streptomyces sp. TaxID=1931 RepID=UPI0039C939A8
MSAGIDQDTYAVLRDRLIAQATELARRTGTLNKARIAEFGSGELTLTGTDRIRTERSGLPRDIVAVGDDVLLFGHHTTTAGRAPRPAGR